MDDMTEITTATIDPHRWPEDDDEYGSRIAVIAQNGNDGQHYKCPPCNQNCNQGRDCPARKADV